jgi:hypothetical protein
MLPGRLTIDTVPPASHAPVRPGWVPVEQLELDFGLWKEWMALATQSPPKRVDNFVTFKCSYSAAVKRDVDRSADSFHDADARPAGILRIFQEQELHI